MKTKTHELDEGWDLDEEDQNVVRAAEEAILEDHGCIASPVRITRADGSMEVRPAYTPEELTEINRPAGGFFSRQRTGA